MNPIVYLISLAKWDAFLKTSHKGRLFSNILCFSTAGISVPLSVRSLCVVHCLVHTSQCVLSCNLYGIPHTGLTCTDGHSRPGSIHHISAPVFCMLEAG